MKTETASADLLTSDLRLPTSDLKLPTSGLQPQDLLRLARWHDDNGRAAQAEAAYRGALDGGLDLDARRECLAHLAALLKRLDRRAEAAPLWEQLASFTLDDPEPFVELAKFYEWHAPDPPQAMQWAERAQKIVGAWPRGWQRDEAARALRHRLARLKAKQRQAERRPANSARRRAGRDDQRFS